jgi:antitoxin StbD
MQPILSNYTASITELKKSPTQILENAGDEVIAILNHNVASAYLVPSKTYEKLMVMLDDYMLSKEVTSRQSEAYTPIKVTLDEL